MVRFCFLSAAILLMASLAFGADKPAEEVREFLASREVVGTVFFAPGETRLGPKAKASIEKMVPRLRALDPRQYLVRVEGKATPDGDPASNVPLSMLRAEAVVDYLRDGFGLKAEVFLTGFGEQGNSTRPKAEIALYENTWNMNDLEIEKTILR